VSWQRPWQRVAAGHLSWTPQTLLLLLLLLPHQQTLVSQQGLYLPINMASASFTFLVLMWHYSGHSRIANI